MTRSERFGWWTSVEPLFRYGAWDTWSYGKGYGGKGRGKYGGKYGYSPY